MSILILGFLVALCVSFCLMPLVIKLSQRLGAISEVGGRHVGDVPVGRLGGLSALLGLISSVIIQCLIDNSVRAVFIDSSDKTYGALGGLLIISGIGFWDDLYRLPASVKLVAQVAAALVAYSFGLRISGLDLPFLEPFKLGVFSLPITLIWIVGIVNAVNLIDGLDGLAGGVLLFASIVNFAAAMSYGAMIPSVVMVSMGGAILGFLFFNWHPAKVYLGDGGAYSFGYILSLCGLLGPVQKATTGIALIVPILAAGLPIFDTLLTVLRRVITKRGIFSPDRGHLHHILLDAGISHRRVVIGLYTFSSALGSLSLVIVFNRNREIGFILLLASAFGIFLWAVLVRKQLRVAMNRIINRGSNSGSGSIAEEEDPV
jgi:UDP-GlcNAc:undecaprenyl-phosphate GlcNAc-1-phosphate transferase